MAAVELPDELPTLVYSLGARGPEHRLLLTPLGWVGK